MSEFFKKINKIDKPSFGVRKVKWKWGLYYQFCRNELQEYYEQLYSNELDNLNENHKFLETQLTKTKSWTENMKTYNWKIGSVVKIPSHQRKAKDQITSLVNFTTHFKKNTSPQTLPKHWRENTSSFYEASITLIPKLGKDTTEQYPLRILMQKSSIQ